MLFFVVVFVIIIIFRHYHDRFVTEFCFEMLEATPGCATLVMTRTTHSHPRASSLRHVCTHSIFIVIDIIISMITDIISDIMVENGPRERMFA